MQFYWAAERNTLRLKAQLIYALILLIKTRELTLAILETIPDLRLVQREGWLMADTAVAPKLKSAVSLVLNSTSEYEGSG